MTDPQDEASKSLEEAFDKYADAIFRYVFLQIHDRDVAKDLAQETFIRYWQCLAKGETVEHERALLYRIAGNLLIDYTRKKKPVSLDALLEQGFEPGHDPLKDTHNRMELQRAIGVLDKLPETYKHTLVLRYVEGMEPTEIAAVTGETSNVISVRIHRGLKQLKSLLDHA